MQETIEKLTLLYNANVTTLGIAFLRGLNNYIETIQTDNFLSKALDLMQEYHQQETLKLAKQASRTDLEIKIVSVATLTRLTYWFNSKNS